MTVPEINTIENCGNKISVTIKLALHVDSLTRRRNLSRHLGGGSEETGILVFERGHRVLCSRTTLIIEMSQISRTH